MDWDDVRSFLAIARARTLSGAARDLGVRQSTMSRRLEALEAERGGWARELAAARSRIEEMHAAQAENDEELEQTLMDIDRQLQGRL